MMLTICDIYGASITDRGGLEKQRREGGRMWKKKKRKQTTINTPACPFGGLDIIDSPIQLPGEHGKCSLSDPSELFTPLCLINTALGHNSHLH